MPSYSPVFSAPFIQFTTPAPNAEYQVPAGFTAVVRQWSCYQDIGGWVMKVGIVDAAGAPELTIVEAGQAGDFNYVAGTGRWVVPGGGYILLSLSSLGSDTSAYVGGYLLRNSLT